MIEIVYASGFTKHQHGRRFSNARLFQKPLTDVDKVYVVGNWPKIVAAYAAINIPVEVVGPAPAEMPVVRPQKRAKAIAVKAVPIVPVMSKNAASIEIPADFVNLKWPDLRRLAKKISDTPAINSAEALVIIEAELQRRAG